MRALVLAFWVICLLKGDACSTPQGSVSEPDAEHRAARTIRVVTYNIQFLPEPASHKNERDEPAYRAQRIAEEMAKFDIVCLQEAFHEDFRRKIIEDIQDTWDGRLNKVVSPTPEGFFTSGGCVLLTHLPIVQSSATVYVNYSTPEEYGLRADGFAAKGAIFARIARSPEQMEDTVDVFVTHLEARADHLRPLQYAQLANFIERVSHPNRSVLLLGDLNTYGMPEYWSIPDSQYSLMMKGLNASRPEGGMIDMWPHLMGEAHGGTTEQDSTGNGKRIDYVLVGIPDALKARLTPLSISVFPYQDPEVGALSDHNAVIAEFEWLK